ncbi:hypothetical protein BH20ACT12_BH20ACT12_01460 [soil metagenome]|nr:type II toxin-antitoxin system PemK/MazF family toxin [Actinomycetota bacterium]
MADEAYARGSVVLVPFPFTDLSGRKRRPALVISPDSFDEQDLILCAITSRVPEDLSPWEVQLRARDMADDRLPKRSMVKVGKLFTMHRRLVAGRFGAVKERKLAEVLGRLRGLFASGRSAEAGPGAVDEAVLALLWANAFAEKVGDMKVWRAWKGMPWEATDRLYEKNLISDPKSKAKSVVLTEEGRRAAEVAFERLFAP